MKKTIALIIALAAACKESPPPPIAAGKCLVDTYAGARATQQHCVFGGYLWSCADNACVRGAETPGELPAATAPATK